MTREITDHLSNLRATLLLLPPTGAKGFEGIIGTALAEIANAPFRLAGSGSQFGLDGRASYKGDGILYECKRYGGDVPRTEVLSKIAERSLDDKLDTDVWALCATTQIRSQLVDDARALGEKIGLNVLVLDWSEIGLPTLAAALAMGGEKVERFLLANTTEETKSEAAVAALQAIRTNPDYVAHRERLHAALNDASLALDKARNANARWLLETFSQRRRAFDRLGQPLSPEASDTTKALTRPLLEEKVRSFIEVAPNGEVLFVLGEEGVGKSWLVATSWIATEKRPLALFLTPDGFDKFNINDDVEDLLIEALIRQAGDADATALSAQWKRRFRHWRSKPVEVSPRLIVVVDGVNQRPAVDWPRIVDRLNDSLEDIGGCLIITTRTAHYQNRIRNRLLAARREIRVTEWTPVERDELLGEAGIDGKVLREAVAEALRNPRLLGIALELFQKAQIEHMEELSVARLLFEHMRTSERDAPTPRTAAEFAAHLRELATQVVSRVTSQQRDDLRIFERGIEAVTDGRFFLPVEGEPNSYELSEDGLTLALGFSVVSHLLAARRNDRDMGEALRAVIEPIAALDRTAQVILAALTIACVDTQYPDEIAASLVEAFAELQNPDEDEFDGFRGLARVRVAAFMQAARDIWLSGTLYPNADWIEGALLSFRASDPKWQEVTDALCEWFSLHSLSPELHIARVRSRQPEEKVQEDIEKRRIKIEESLGELSEYEGTLLDASSQENGDLSALARLAFFLIAGNPVAPFAKHLVLWCFTTSLNSDLWLPDKEFQHLIRLNRIDWSETREALLKHSEGLQQPGISKTGQWAYVKVLRATGLPDDAVAAEALVAELTKGKEFPQGWRLVEDYCATDPCDPNSERPDNISNTARNYAAIDVSKLRTDRGVTSEDRFFVMARPGIVRFEENVGLQKHLKLADNVLGRQGYPLRQGLFELENHVAILGRERALRFLELAKRQDLSDTLSEDQRWIAAQYPILLAFPYLSGEEQVEAILEPEIGDNMLLSTMRHAKTLDGESFERLLSAAAETSDERAQFLLLAFARFSNTPLSRRTNELTANLLGSDSKRVRTEALGLAAISDDTGLVQRFIDSEWEADLPEGRDNTYEEWFGSLALLNARRKGLISDEEVLDRVSPQLYGRAAAALDSGAVKQITQRIDAAINHLANLEADTAIPDIELLIDTPSNIQPARVNLSAREEQTNDPIEALRQFSESDEDFEDRQRRNYDAFLAFQERLTNASAKIILESVELEEFEAIVDADREIADRWYDLFMNMTGLGRPNVCNFALMLGYALSKTAPEKAVQLFRHFYGVRPLVRYSFGAAGLSLETIAIWASADDPAIMNLRWERLDRAETDEELSLEVLAALWHGKGDLLSQYIDAQLEIAEPSPIARALMVAGFANQNARSEELFTLYEGASGFLGEACKAARYASERNIWAQHWFHHMCNAPDAEAFWRYSILSAKIVDGRIRTWRDDVTERSETMETFVSTVEDAAAKRIKKWGEKRRKTLFGQGAPEPQFLQTT